jgi:hypothetical protein
MGVTDLPITDPDDTTRNLEPIRETLSLASKNVPKLKKILLWMHHEELTGFILITDIYTILMHMILKKPS